MYHEMRACSITAKELCLCQAVSLLLQQAASVPVVCLRVPWVSGRRCGVWSTCIGVVGCGLRSPFTASHCPSVVMYYARLVCGLCVHCAVKGVFCAEVNHLAGPVALAGLVLDPLCSYV